MTISNVQSALANLRKAVSGPVRLPGDAGWDDARRPWALAVEQQPAAVVSVRDSADIVATLRLAREAGLSVAAQPLGHGATRALDGAVLLRTGALDSLTIDASAQVARVGAGVRWRDVMAALDGTGLIGLPGSIGGVSVVGYSLAGGLSWFGRRFGIAAGAIRSVELVDAQGESRRVDESTDPELLWALRGGGGEFGIVTSMEVDLFRVPGLFGGSVSFDLADAPAVLAAYARVTLQAPPELTLWAGIIHFPPLPELAPQLRGQSFVTVSATFLGDAAGAEPALAEIRAAGTVVTEGFAPLPASKVDAIAQEPDEPSPGVSRTWLLHRFDDATIERLIAVHGDRDTAALTAVQVRHLGGALAEGDPTRASAGSVGEPFLVGAVGIARPGQPGGAERLADGFTRLGQALAPEASDRALLAFLPEGEPVGRVFDASGLNRLRAVKRRVDPGGVIRSNHPILD